MTEVTIKKGLQKCFIDVIFIFEMVFYMVAIWTYKKDNG